MLGIECGYNLTPCRAPVLHVGGDPQQYTDNDDREGKDKGDDDVSGHSQAEIHGAPLTGGEEAEIE